MDHIRGLLYGGALGDALGAPHEFAYQKDVYTGRLEYPLRYRTRFMKSGVYKVGVVGQITDDTEMELCILHSLVETKGKIVRESLLKHYLKWANDKQTIFMGINTRNLLKGVTTIKGYDARYAKTFTPETKSSWSQSNGCLMRAGILAVAEKLSGDDALIDCKITNPSPACLEVVRLYLDLIKMALDESTKESILQLLQNYQTTNKDIMTSISEAINNKRRNVTGSTKGWIMHGLYCALWSLLHFDTYHDGINAVIKLGGDTDTNASIAGDLLGAFYGYSKMVKDPTTAYNIDVLRECDTSKGDLKRSKEYDVKCIEQLLASVEGFQ